MEEFDLNFDNDIGTSVSKIKEMQNRPDHNISANESEIDYETIIENLNNSDQNNYRDPRPLPSYEPDIEVPLNNRVQKRTVENFNSCKSCNNNIKNNKNDLMKNYFTNSVNNVNLNEPLPANFSKQMLKKDTDPIKTVQVLPQYNKEDKNKEPVQSTQTELNNQDTSIINSQIRDIFFYVLLFMLLNNKFIIEFIYDRVPYMKKYDSPYPNLILRSLIFGGLIYLIKRMDFML